MAITVATNNASMLCACFLRKEKIPKKKKILPGAFEGKRDGDNCDE